MREMKIYDEADFSVDHLVKGIVSDGAAAINANLTEGQLEDIRLSCLEKLPDKMVLRMQRILTEDGPVYVFRDPNRISRAEARPMIYRKRDKPPRRHRQARKRV